jgi:hypothetical protein
MNIPFPLAAASFCFATAVLAVYLHHRRVGAVPVNTSHVNTRNESDAATVAGGTGTAHRIEQETRFPPQAETQTPDDDDADDSEYQRADPSKPRYKPRSILTDNEAEFFGRLETAVPEYRIFPQLSMTAIIEPASKDRYWTYFNRIAMQRVDYAVYTRDLKLICVIELDDRTHDGKHKRDERRDSRLTEAGVQTLRFDSRMKPRPEMLRAAIRRVVHHSP